MTPDQALWLVQAMIRWAPFLCLWLDFNAVAFPLITLAGFSLERARHEQRQRVRDRDGAGCSFTHETKV